MHTSRSSLLPLLNKQLKRVSRLEAPLREDSTSIELRVAPGSSHGERDV